METGTGSVQSVIAEEQQAAEALSDEELTALALSADSDAPLADDAVPMDIHLAQFGSLPLWYMPPAMSRGGRRWKAPFVIAAVAAFLLIDAAGLCNTYGLLGFA